MKKLKSLFLALSLIAFAFGTAQANVIDNNNVEISKEDNGYKHGSVDYLYAEPEMFFTTPHEIKLSVLWEILNCFVWENHVPVDKCFNLEFVVKNKIVENGDSSGTSNEEDEYLWQIYTSDIEGADCLTGSCEAIIRLPLVALLTPLEHANYKEGLMVMKSLKLFLGYAGEEDEEGRIIDRELSKTCYKLDYILNPTGYGTISIVKFKRIKHCGKNPYPAPPFEF